MHPRYYTVLCVLAGVLSPWMRGIGEEAGVSSAFGGDKTRGVEVQLAREGRALLPIVVASAASERTRSAARELEEYLERISGADFSIEEGDGSSGIVLGTCGDFPERVRGVDLDPSHPWRRDEYLLRSQGDGLWLLGAGDQAVEHAVWDLLSRLGYRLFFLTDTWEVVPEIRDVRLTVDSKEAPDYVTRLAPRGAPYSSRELWARWKKRNRVSSAFQLHTGHSYEGIIRANEDIFKANPEYLALVNGKRGGSKFCISNPGLRKLVTEHAVRAFEKNPDRDSISLDPSDGGGWCQCEDCARMGSVSDRVVLLANQAAEAINQLGLGPKYVGIYGYASHSIPPDVRVHPNVIVSLATSFIRGGQTIDSMVQGWSRQGAVLGIREYHDVFTWSHDLPRRARGGKPAYLQRTIPHFYRNGARFMNSEATDSWAANGLGFWITPILLWDVGKAEQIDDLFEDFIDKSFAGAKGPMREFYRLMNFDRSLSTHEDMLARMYRFLRQAWDLTEQAQVRKRLEDLVLYVRYLELYHAYRQADASSGKAFAGQAEAPRLEGNALVVPSMVPELSPRQKAYNKLSLHVLRMRDRYMVSAYYIVTRDRYRDGSIMPYASSDAEGEGSGSEAMEILLGGSREKPEDRPFSVAEVQAILNEGMAANQPLVLDFDPATFSERLVPHHALEGAASGHNIYFVGEGGHSLTGRGRREYLVWLEEPGALELKVTGGLIRHYQDRGNVKISLFCDQHETSGPVAQDESVPPDAEEHRIILQKSPYAGLHTLQVSDGSDKTRIVLSEDIPLTVASGINDNPKGWPGRQGKAFFYVPRGTQTLGGYAGELSGWIRDGDGTVVFRFEEMERAGYFSLSVPAGQDGKFWQLENCNGHRRLMTVPPFLARTPEQLLLPIEVVEKDF